MSDIERLVREYDTILRCVADFAATEAEVTWPIEWSKQLHRRAVALGLMDCDPRTGVEDVKGRQVEEDGDSGVRGVRGDVPDVAQGVEAQDLGPREAHVVPDVPEGHGPQAEVGVVSVQLDDGAYMPERAHSTDAGADLMTPSAFILHSGRSKVIDTGVHVELPHGTVGLLKSKSGLHVLHGITSEGVIDEGYTGSIHVRLHNSGPHSHLFHEGDKVTQLVIVPALYPDFEQVGEIAGGPRGDSGFGSTGA